MPRALTGETDTSSGKRVKPLNKYGTSFVETRIDWDHTGDGFGHNITNMTCYWHTTAIIWFQRKRTYTHFLICCPIFVKFTFLVMYSFKVGCVHGANFWLNIIQNAAATQHSNMGTNLEVQHTEGLAMELVAIHEFSENWTHTEIMAPQQSPNEQNYSCQRSQLCKCWCPKIKSYTLKTKIHQKNIYQFKTIYARRCQTKKSSLDKSKCEKRCCLLPTLRSILLLWNLTFGSVTKSPG